MPNLFIYIRPIEYTNKCKLDTTKKTYLKKVKWKYQTLRPLPTLSYMLYICLTILELNVIK